MKLPIKFNLIFIFSFGIGLLVAAFISNLIVQNNAREQVLENASLMMETTLATRTYTDEQISPLLNDPANNPNGTFHPQGVPAYAATENFNYLRQRYPAYSYKEAALNPTNPRDRATDWEADIISSFRNDDTLTEMSGTRATPSGNVLYLARPIRIASASCLACHSTPDQAPASMLKLYGRDNGFGWKLHEAIGAQIVQVPTSVPISQANQAFTVLIASLVAVFLITLVVLNIVLHIAVIKPVAKLSLLADQVSMGKLDVPEFNVKGNDEISVLAKSFNRMQRSLVKALKMLDE
jgi:protein-histidine pros-kinase